MKRMHDENEFSLSTYLAACLLCDVALSIGIFGTMTTSSSEPADISSLKTKVFLKLYDSVPFAFSTMFTFSHVSLFSKKNREREQEKINL